MNNKGFTMIELLAVFVILGILSMITIPAVTKYIQKAKDENYEALATSSYNASKNYLMNFDYTTGNEISLDKLLQEDLLNNIEDPYDKEKTCTGKVQVEKEITDNSIFEDYKYTVYLCCSNHNYKFYFDNNDELKDKEVINSNQCKMKESSSDSESVTDPDRYTIEYPEIKYIKYRTRSSVSTRDDCQLYPNKNNCNFNETKISDSTISSCTNIDFSSKEKCESQGYGKEWSEQNITENNQLRVYSANGKKSQFLIDDIVFNESSDYITISDDSDIKKGDVITITSDNPIIKKTIKIKDNAGNEYNIDVNFYFTGTGGTDMELKLEEKKGTTYLFKYMSKDFTEYKAKTGWINKTWVRIWESKPSANRVINGYWYLSDENYKLVTSNSTYNGKELDYAYTKNGIKYYDVCSVEEYMGSKEGCQLVGWYLIDGFYYYFYTTEDTSSKVVNSTDYAWGQSLSNVTVKIYNNSECYYSSKVTNCERKTYIFNNIGQCENCNNGNEPVTRN